MEVEVWGATLALGETFRDRASNESELDVVLAPPAVCCIGLEVFVRVLFCECTGSKLLTSGLAVVRLPTLWLPVSLTGLVVCVGEWRILKSACTELLVSMVCLLTAVGACQSTTHDRECGLGTSGFAWAILNFN